MAAMQKLRASGGRRSSRTVSGRSSCSAAVYAAIVAVAVARVCATLDPTYSVSLLTMSGIAWARTFFGFALAYAPLLCRSRKF